MKNIRHINRNFFAFCLLFILLLSGCGKTDNGGEKKVIVYSVYNINRSMDEYGNYLPSDLEKLVQEFNLQSKEYEIELQIGEDENLDIYAYNQKIHTEIIAGKGPDIISAHSADISLMNYVNAGVLEDLTPYIERDLHTEDYIESIFHAYEENGKVYALQPTFALIPYVTDASLYAKQDVISFSEILSLMDEHPNLVSFNGQDKMRLLQECCLNWGWDERDMDALREYILFAEKYGIMLEYDEDTPGENCFVKKMSLSQPDGLALYRYTLEYFRNIKQPEYFVLFGIEGFNFCIQEGEAYGMNASSKNKEGVWEFLKFLLSKETQEKYQPRRFDASMTPIGSYHQGFPVRKEQFEILVEEAKTPAKDQEWMKIWHGSMRDGSQYFKEEDVLNEMGTLCLSEKDEETLRRLIDNAVPAIWGGHLEAWNIVSEEVAYYYDGKKTLDECLSIIEQRLKLYHAERD